MTNPPENKELTVLDYVRALFSFERGEGSPMTDQNGHQLAIEGSQGEAQSGVESRPKGPVLLLFALGLITAGQSVLSLGDRAAVWIGVVFFVAGGYLILAAWKRKELSPIIPEVGRQQPLGNTFQILWLVPGALFAILAFLALSSGTWTLPGLLAWLLSLVCVLQTIRSTRRPARPGFTPLFRRAWQAMMLDKPFLVGALLVIAVVLVFQFSSLRSTPPEMISAQAEHFYSVLEVRDGSFPLVFPRNVVLEPLSYYWAAFWTSFGTGELTFVALKAAYALSALIAVFFGFKIGQLLYSKWVGLAAAGLMGVGLWPILQSRAVLGGGMVLALFTAVLYYLLNALVSSKPKLFLVAGILTGLGIMANKALLMLPLTNILIFVIWALREDSAEQRKSNIPAFGMGAIAGIFTLVPLLRAITFNPASYFAEIVSRATNAEVAINGNPLLVFLNNWLSSLGIVNWFNRSSWVDGIPSRGAVDGLTAVFFIVGLVFMLGQYRKTKRWLDLVLILLFPLFLVPSAMALAFPNEVPSLSRALGTAFPTFMIAAIGLTGTISAITQARGYSGRILAIFLAVLAGGLIAFQNHGLIFGEYVSNYTASSWNTREMGQVIQNFRKGYGTDAQVWLVGYPYWVDARVVAIEAGDLRADIALTAEQVQEKSASTSAQLFIVKPEDQAVLAILQQVFPNGVSTTYQSTRQDRNFILYIIPGT